MAVLKYDHQIMVCLCFKGPIGLGNPICEDLNKFVRFEANRRLRRVEKLQRGEQHSRGATRE
ncbi:hypothetical protein Syun_030716 [Stephania yunnanensis]|uniref:Uncharacterized protein n=1 Tax=Stephania yunnanensis TaxID=152371 RepID=A0AAP0E362_9MAGN